MIESFVIIAIFLSIVVYYYATNQKFAKSLKPIFIYTVAITPLAIFMLVSGRVAEFSTGYFSIKTKIDTIIQSTIDESEDWIAVDSTQILLVTNQNINKWLSDGDPSDTELSDGEPSDTEPLGGEDQPDTDLTGGEQPEIELPGATNESCPAIVGIDKAWISLQHSQMKESIVQCLLDPPPGGMLAAPRNHSHSSGIIIRNSDNTLYGIVFLIDERLIKLTDGIRTLLSEGLFDNIESIIRERVSLTESTTKALMLIRRHDLQNIPVVDDDNMFRGFANKERIINSIVLSLTDQL